MIRVAVPFQAEEGDHACRLLGQISYKDAPRDKVKLPKRQKRHGYREPDYPFKFIKERY